MKSLNILELLWPFLIVLTIKLNQKIKYENKDKKDNCKLEVSKLDYTNSPYKKIWEISEVNSERVILKKSEKLKVLKI